MKRNLSYIIFFVFILLGLVNTAFASDYEITSSWPAFNIGSEEKVMVSVEFKNNSATNITLGSLTVNNLPQSFVISDVSVTNSVITNNIINFPVAPTVNANASLTVTYYLTIGCAQLSNSSTGLGLSHSFTLGNNTVVNNTNENSGQVPNFPTLSISIGDTYYNSSILNASDNTLYFCKQYSKEITILNSSISKVKKIRLEVDNIPVGFNLKINGLAGTAIPASTTNGKYFEVNVPQASPQSLVVTQTFDNSSETSFQLTYRAFPIANGNICSNSNNNNIITLGYLYKSFYEEGLKSNLTLQDGESVYSLKKGGINKLEYNFKNENTRIDADVSVNTILIPATWNSTINVTKVQLNGVDLPYVFDNTNKILSLTVPAIVNINKYIKIQYTEIAGCSFNSNNVRNIVNYTFGCYSTSFHKNFSYENSFPFTLNEDLTSIDLTLNDIAKAYQIDGNILTYQNYNYLSTQTYDKYYLKVEFLNGGNPISNSGTYFNVNATSGVSKINGYPNSTQNFFLFSSLTTTPDPNINYLNGNYINALTLAYISSLGVDSAYVKFSIYVGENITQANACFNEIFSETKYISLSNNGGPGSGGCPVSLNTFLVNRNSFGKWKGSTTTNVLDNADYNLLRQATSSDDIELKAAITADELLISAQGTKLTSLSDKKAYFRISSQFPGIPTAINNWQNATLKGYESGLPVTYTLMVIPNIDDPTVVYYALDQYLKLFDLNTNFTIETKAYVNSTEQSVNISKNSDFFKAQIRFYDEINGTSFCNTQNKGDKFKVFLLKKYLQPLNYFYSFDCSFQYQIYLFDNAYISKDIFKNEFRVRNSIDFQFNDLRYSSFNKNIKFNLYSANEFVNGEYQNISCLVNNTVSLQYNVTDNVFANTTLSQQQQAIYLPNSANFLNTTPSKEYITGKVLNAILPLSTSANKNVYYYIKLKPQTSIADLSDIQLSIEGCHFRPISNGSTSEYLFVSDGSPISISGQKSIDFQAINKTCLSTYNLVFDLYESCSNSCTNLNELKRLTSTSATVNFEVYEPSLNFTTNTTQANNSANYLQLQNCQNVTLQGSISNQGLGSIYNPVLWLNLPSPLEISQATLVFSKSGSSPVTVIVQASDIKNNLQGTLTGVNGNYIRAIFLKDVLGTLNSDFILQNTDQISYSFALNNTCSNYFDPEFPLTVGVVSYKGCGQSLDKDNRVTFKVLPAGWNYTPTNSLPVMSLTPVIFEKCNSEEVTMVASVDFKNVTITNDSYLLQLDLPEGLEYISADGSPTVENNKTLRWTILPASIVNDLVSWNIKVKLTKVIIGMDIDLRLRKKVAVPSCNISSPSGSYCDGNVYVTVGTSSQEVAFKPGLYDCEIDGETILCAKEKGKHLIYPYNLNILSATNITWSFTPNFSDGIITTTIANPNQNPVIVDYLVNNIPLIGIANYGTLRISYKVGTQTYTKSVNISLEVPTQQTTEFEIEVPCPGKSVIKGQTIKLRVLNYSPNSLYKYDTDEDGIYDLATSREVTNFKTKRSGKYKISMIKQTGACELNATPIEIDVIDYSTDPIRKEICEARNETANLGLLLNGSIASTTNLAWYYKDIRLPNAVYTKIPNANSPTYVATKPGKYKVVLFDYSCLTQAEIDALGNTNSPAIKRILDKEFRDIENNENTLTAGLNKVISTQSNMSQLNLTSSTIGYVAYIEIRVYEKICFTPPECPEDDLEVVCVPCEELCSSIFNPIQGKKYLASVWVKEDIDAKSNLRGTGGLEFTYSVSTNGVGSNIVNAFTVDPNTPIIDGWQKLQAIIDIPLGTKSVAIRLLPSTTFDIYYDDIRFNPFDGTMKSYVYEAETSKLMAELDENNYATIYEYDNQGKLVRVKKETERGVYTIQENRENTHVKK